MCNEGLAWFHPPHAVVNKRNMIFGPSLQKIKFVTPCNSKITAVSPLINIFVYYIYTNNNVENITKYCKVKIKMENQTAP
jgi:hypothetical protein